MTRKAETQLRSFPRIDQERIRDKLRFFADQQNPLSFAKYIDEKKYRFRVGDIRIMFTVKNGTIHIGKIERRDKAYD